MTAKGWFIVALAYCSILVGGWTSTQIKTDFSLTTLSTRNSADYQNYKEYSKRFPSDSRGLVVSVGLNSKFNSPEGFYVLEELRKEFAQQKGVETAVGITSVELARKTLFGSKSSLVFPISNENKFDKYYRRLAKYKDVTPKFLSEDRTAARIFLKVDWEKVRLDQIKDAVNSYKFDEVHFMGKGVFAEEIKSFLESEILLLPLFAGAILLFLFFVWFRDVRSLIVVASILMINLSLLSLVFYFSGINIGLLTSTTPLLILVLSFSDIVHIVYKFKQIKGGSIQERISKAINPLKLPLWLTTLTTALAFGLFFVTGITEISEFALVTCAGIMLAYLTARWLIPLFLKLYRIRPFKKRAAFTYSANLLVKILRSKKAVLILSALVLIIVSVSVISRFNINISYHQTYGEDTKLGQAMRFSDAHFEGVRSIEVILKSKNGLNEETISKVAEVEKELLDNYGCRSVFSVNTALKRLNRYNRFGKASQYVLPDKIDETFLSDLKKYKQELGLVNAMTNDQQLYRIVGRLPDIGSAKSREKNQALQSKLDEIQSDNHQFFISGFAYVKDQSTTRVTGFILIGISLSLIISMIVIGSVFRSVRIAIISFFPNLLPVLFGLALMYWTGIELNPTTAMALSIILGLALDDTIYFLSSIKRNENAEGSDSIEFSLRENTFPAAVTSIILMIGFGILLLSSIESNRNIGLLVATMLFIALISDLIILPALLSAFWKKRT